MPGYVGLGQTRINLHVRNLLLCIIHGKINITFIVEHLHHRIL